MHHFCTRSRVFASLLVAGEQDVLLQPEQLDIIDEVEANATGGICERDLQAPNRLDCRIPSDVVNGLHVFAGVIDLRL